MKAKKDIFAQNEGKIGMVFRENDLFEAQMENGSERYALQMPSTRAGQQLWKEMAQKASEMAALMRLLEEEERKIVPEGSKAQRTMTLFQRLVQKYASQERTVGFYARRLQLTPHYLCALVKKSSGRTVMRWVNEEVIREAKDLLGSRVLQTQEVARELGFPDHASFTKFFKRETGLTPQAFRAGVSSSQS